MRALALAIVLASLVVAPVSACGARNAEGPRIPPLAAALDDLLPQVPLAPAEREAVTALRAQVGELAANGQEGAAREVEEQAMRILGFSKLWLACGPGTFVWAKFS